MVPGSGSNDAEAGMTLHPGTGDVGDFVRGKLCEIAGIYGRSLLDHPQRCEAILRDLCPKERREVFLIVSALKEQVPADLLVALDVVSDDAIIAKLTRKLCDHLGLAPDAAAWAVESWLMGVRVMASTKPSATLSSSMAAPWNTSPIADSAEHSDIRNRVWFSCCAGIMISAIAALIVVAWATLHHDWSSFTGWLVETATMSAELGFIAFVHTWLARRLSRSPRPLLDEIHSDWLTAALLVEVVVLLLLPVVPVAGISLWCAEWAGEFHLAGHAHDLSFHFSRILQSLLFCAFMVQWVRTMIRIQGRIAFSMVRRRP